MSKALVKRQIRDGFVSFYLAAKNSMPKVQVERLEIPDELLGEIRAKKRRFAYGYDKGREAWVGVLVGRELFNLRLCFWGHVGYLVKMAAPEEQI